MSGVQSDVNSINYRDVYSVNENDHPAHAAANRDPDLIPAGPEVFRAQIMRGVAFHLEFLEHLWRVGLVDLQVGPAALQLERGRTPNHLEREGEERNLEVLPPKYVGGVDALVTLSDGDADARIDVSDVFRDLEILGHGHVEVRGL